MAEQTDRYAGRCALWTAMALAGLVGACAPIKTDTEVNGHVNAHIEGPLYGRLAHDARLDGNLTTNLTGQLGTSLRLEGPMTIQVQVQGAGIKYEGTYISDELFDHVKLNEATDDWVLAVFGPPSARTPLRDGTEIWRWVYRPTSQESPIFEVFNKSEKEPKLATRAVFVQFRNQVVIKKWKG
jgi:hypothetical protein